MDSSFSWQEVSFPEKMESILADKVQEEDE